MDFFTVRVSVGPIKTSLFLIGSYSSMIKTKSIYEQASVNDGLRVLVMRYWPRGIRKEACGLWLKALGPSAGLIREWKDEAIDWAQFRKDISQSTSPTRKNPWL